MSFMNFIPRVRCGRCDRSYSGLKLRCPHCGASRSRGGKRVADAADAAARRMIKVLILFVLVVTVVSIAVMDLSADPAENGDDRNIMEGQGVGNGENGDNQNGDMDNGAALPTPEPPPPQIEVTSIDISWRAKREGVNDLTLRVGDELEIWAEVFPTDADVTVNWERDDHLVANITINAEDHRRVTLEARGTGQTLIRATAGEESTEVIVRVR